MVVLTTFYETAKEAYEHRQNVDSLKTALENKQAEVDPIQTQIDELNNTAMQELDYSAINDLTNFPRFKNF